ncbi:MAG: FG-GAP-like repeat-containing protein [Thermoplasmatota archaeon]
MKRKMALILSAIMTFGFFLTVFAVDIQAEKTDNLYDNSNIPVKGGVISIPDGGGIDTSYYIRLNRDVPISYAAMNISTYDAATGTSLREPFIDFGVDGKIDWKYSGTGKGDFGEQTFLSDGRTKLTMDFGSSGGINAQNSILIPEGADIASAQVDMRGRFIPDSSLSQYIIAEDPSSVSMAGYAMEHGDIDGDGDDDIVVSDTRNSRIIWFENPDDITAEDWNYTVIGTSVSNCYSLDVGDMDDDGDLDVVATSYSYGRMYYYENSKSGSSWSRTQLSTYFRYAGRIRIADINQDGNPDIVVAPYYKYYSGLYLYWFQAPSDPSSTTYWTGRSLGNAPYTYCYPYLAMDVGDFNNDGYPDVAIGAYYYYSANRVWVYLNPKSTSSSWSSYTVDSSSNTPFTLSVGEYTGDSYDDIVVGTLGSDDITIYRNGGTGTSWSEHRVASFTDPRGLRSVDVNGDSKTDIIAGGGTPYYLRVYIQGSSWTSWSTKTIASDIMNPQAFSVYDIDDDDDNDMIVTGHSGSQLVIYENTNEAVPSFTSRWLEDGGVKDIRSVDYTDIDKDGDTDMLISGYGTGFVGWWENDYTGDNSDGNPFDTPGKLHRVGGIASPIKAMWGDIDADGDMDAAAVSYSGGVSWFENPGNPKNPWTTHWVNNGYGSVVSFFVGDCTGDGRADILTSSAGGWSGGGRIRLFMAPADPTSQSWSYTDIATGLSYHANIWGDDMDLDGDLDILAVGGQWGSGGVTYYRNPGGSNPSGTWAGVTVAGGLYYPNDVKTIDIDDDGYPDVVTTERYYYYYKCYVRWYQNPGGSSGTGGWKGYVISKTDYNWNLAVGDIGNDGYADVIFSRGSYSYPTTIYWMEEPDDYDDIWISHNLGGHTRTWGLGVADINNDGLDDIMSSSQSLDEVKVYRMEVTYPQNVELDVGADEIVADWSYDGEMTDQYTASITGALQDVVDNLPQSVTRFEDSYGTPMLSIPLEVHSDTLGKVAVENIHIVYDVSVRVKEDGKGGHLKDVFDRLVPDYQDSGETTTRVYIGIGASSGGAAYINDVDVQFNAKPRMVDKLPEIWVNEDEKRTFSFDLTNFFKDDYTDSKDLKFNIMLRGPMSDRVDAYIINNRLTVDAEISPNFYTRNSIPPEIQGIISVTDDGGPGDVEVRTYYTDPFEISVRPMNDVPIRTEETLPDMTAYEGSATLMEDLDDYTLFEDVDGDSLTYHLEARVADLENYDHARDNFRIYVNSDNVLIASLSEDSDWVGEVTVDLYATDQAQLTGNDPSLDFKVNVLNINDGPSWDYIGSFEINEDTAGPNLVELTQHVVDIDNSRRDFEIQVLSYTNRSFSTITADRTNDGMVYLNYLPKVENWNGHTTVTLRVSDGEYSDETTVDIEILPVNDPPSISILEPYEDGYIDGGESFSVVGDAYDIEEIEWVDVFWEGEWKRALGTNTWGITLLSPRLDEKTIGYPIEARVFDGYEFSYAKVNVTIMKYIEPTDPDWDDDGVPNIMDDFPEDPSEWVDSDGDEVGDNSDAFPNDVQWQYDFDKDGFANRADTHDWDPQLWDDKNDNGINDFDEGKVRISGGDEEEEGKNYIIPILLWLIAFLVLIFMGLVIYGFVRKNSASKDPVKSARYAAAQQRRREKVHDLLEKLPMAHAASRMDKIAGGKSGAPSPVAGAAPLSAPMPTMGRVSPALSPAGIRPGMALPPAGRPPVSPVQAQQVRPMPPLNR